MLSCLAVAVQANSARLSAPCTALPTAVLASGWPAVAFDREFALYSLLLLGFWQDTSRCCILIRVCLLSLLHPGWMMHIVYNKYW